MQDAGNFNYGATGKALGIPASVLKRAGGIVQIGTGTSSWNFASSHFDDPEDQEMIQAGIDWYDKNYGGTSLNYNLNYGEYDVDSGNVDWNLYE